MKTVRVTLRGNYKKSSYRFGYSQINIISTVVNWQVGNNKFEIENDGVYYFFSQRVGSNNYSVIQKVVNCAGGQLPCIISFIAPYYIPTAPQDNYETDWTDGVASGNDCVITFLPPYTV